MPNPPDLLNEAARRLAAIVESSDDAVISKDLEGTVQSWNRGATEIFGYTADEMIGKSVRILIPDDRQQEEGVILGSIREGKHIKHYESIRKRKDGTLINVSLTVSPIRDDQGVVIGASKIARDITEQKGLEDALGEANRQKDQFLATLAHELRNPLVPLRNGMDLLTDDRDVPVKAMMKRQVDQLIRLVDDLMDLNRVTMGRIELLMEPVSIKDVIETAVEASAHLIESRGQTLDVILGTRSPVVKGDKARLVQVLVNLLNNASKYTDLGGHIELRLRNGASGIEIVVRDNGIGFKEGTIDNAFQMFTQISGGNGSPNTGLGIGLHIVRKLVEMHGGSIDAHSGGLGKGSEFVVRLKESMEPVLAPKNPSDPFGKAIQAKRVLIADDNEDAILTMSMLLRKQGHEVIVAYNGLDAVKLALEHQPDVTIMDIGMPLMNGYEACKALRDAPEGKGLKVVALSGWGQKEDFEKSSKAGFDVHLVKPIEPKDLFRVVNA